MIKQDSVEGQASRIDERYLFYYKRDTIADHIEKSYFSFKTFQSNIFDIGR